MCRIHAQRNQTDITVSHLRKPIAQNWSHYTPPQYVDRLNISIVFLITMLLLSNDSKKSQ